MAEDTWESDPEKNLPNTKEHPAVMSTMGREAGDCVCGIFEKHRRKAWMQGAAVLPRLRVDEMMVWQEDSTLYEIPRWAEQFLDGERPCRPQGKVYFPCFFPSTWTYPSQLSNLSYTFNEYP